MYQPFWLISFSYSSLTILTAPQNIRLNFSQLSLINNLASPWSESTSDWLRIRIWSLAFGFDFWFNHSIFNNNFIFDFSFDSWCLAFDWLLFDFSLIWYLVSCLSLTLQTPLSRWSLKLPCRWLVLTTKWLNNLRIWEFSPLVVSLL